MSIVRLPGLAAGLAGWLCVSLAAPLMAQAQDAKTPSKQERQAAREAYDKGTKAFEKGDYIEALDSFVKANALIPSVQAMFWIARAQDQAGKPDAAIEAYEAVTRRADYAKLSEDKQATVRERLATLKAQQAPPPAEPPPAVPAPVEPPPAEPPPPAPVVQETPIEPLPLPVVHSDSDDYLPKKNLGELGIMGGALFVGGNNNLAAAGKSPGEYKKPVWQMGARAAFFPERVFGVEVEYAHGFGRLENDAGGSESANFDSLRGHLIGQLPSSRAVPFALIGGGILRAQSDTTGADTDFLFEAGVGLKVMATKLLAPRLDARLGLTQKEGGGFSDGLAPHAEVLLGLSFVLGR